MAGRRVPGEPSVDVALLVLIVEEASQQSDAGADPRAESRIPSESSKGRAAGGGAYHAACRPLTGRLAAGPKCHNQCKRDGEWKSFHSPSPDGDMFSDYGCRHVNWRDWIGMARGVGGDA